MADLFTYITRLPASGCESDEHPFAGQCDEECAWLADAMQGDGYTETMIYGDYLGGSSTIDWSGCHNPEPRPEQRVTLDTVNHAVIYVMEHPEDCQCDDDACPAYLAYLAETTPTEGTA